MVLKICGFSLGEGRSVFRIDVLLSLLLLSNGSRIVAMRRLHRHLLLWLQLKVRHLPRLQLLSDLALCWLLLIGVCVDDMCHSVGPA